MRLQIELMGHTVETDELTGDISEMEEMLNAYLAFARGEEAEPAILVNIAELLGEIVTSAKRENPNISLDAPDNIDIILRRNAMKRCITNLVGNALRYGNRAEISAARNDESVIITVDDNGTGIDAKRREDMFRPFTRMEPSRNSDTGGVGLGLTIARDIARFHGGDVVLEDSPLGGLRARIWIPV
jgi:two-component system osmolarity sensor histidine kinase EnvZ